MHLFLFDLYFFYIFVPQLFVNCKLFTGHNPGIFVTQSSMKTIIDDHIPSTTANDYENEFRNDSKNEGNKNVRVMRNERMKNIVKGRTDNGNAIKATNIELAPIDIVNDMDIDRIHIDSNGTVIILDDDETKTIDITTRNSTSGVGRFGITDDNISDSSDSSYDDSNSNSNKNGIFPMDVEGCTNHIIQEPDSSSDSVNNIAQKTQTTSQEAPD